MSAVSIPIPITLASNRTIACGPVSGARSSRSARVFSIELICSRTNASRANVAPELLDDVCRQARALRGPQTCQTLWSLTQMWLESPDPQTGKRTLHAVDDA